MPTFQDTATLNQMRQVGQWEGKSYPSADPSYLTDLKSGWESGKYSYEDVLDAYGRLQTQGSMAPPPAVAPPPATSDEQEEEVGLEPVESGYVSSYSNPLSDDIYALVKEQLSYTSRRLNDIEQARKLGNMTGTLTSEEKAMFDEMETSAVANLKSQVNDQTKEVWDTAIADLVNRGVLQGTVGEKILGEIGSESLKMVAEGVNTIRGTKNAQMLSTIEGNKNRALTWQQMLTNESLGLLGMGAGYSNQLSTENMAAESRALQNALGELSASVQLAGISSNEAIAKSNQALQQALAAMQRQTSLDVAGLNASTTKYGLDLDAATRLAIANMQSSASTQASKYGLYGNLGSAGAGLALKITDTDWFKNLFKNTNTNTSTTGSDWNLGVNTNTGQSFWDEV